MKVFIYFNLRKKLWSVKALQGPDRGRVIKHCDSFTLEHAQFKVSESGRQRVLREKRKNVHAGIVGIWCGAHGSGHLENSVTYNPYKYNTFVDRQTEKPVYCAHVVSAYGRQVTYQ